MTSSSARDPVSLLSTALGSDLDASLAALCAVDEMLLDWASGDDESYVRRMNLASRFCYAARRGVFVNGQ